MRAANEASVHFTLSRATQDEPRSRFGWGLPFSFRVLRTCDEATGQHRNGDHGNEQTDEHTHSFSTRTAGIRWESRVRRPPLRIPSRACNRTDEHTAHRGPAPRYRRPPRCRSRLRRRAERSGRKVHRWGPAFRREERRLPHKSPPLRDRCTTAAPSKGAATPECRRLRKLRESPQRTSRRDIALRADTNHRRNPREAHTPRRRPANRGKACTSPAFEPLQLLRRRSRWPRDTQARAPRPFGGSCTRGRTRARRPDLRRFGQPTTRHTRPSTPHRWGYIRSSAQGRSLSRTMLRPPRPLGWVRRLPSSHPRLNRSPRYRRPPSVPYLHRRRHPTPGRHSRSSSCPGRKSRLELALPSFSARHMPRPESLTIWPSQRRVWCSRDT